MSLTADPEHPFHGMPDNEYLLARNLSDKALGFNDGIHNAAIKFKESHGRWPVAARCSPETHERIIELNKDASDMYDPYREKFPPRDPADYEEEDWDDEDYEGNTEDVETATQFDGYEIVSKCFLDIMPSSFTSIPIVACDWVPFWCFEFHDGEKWNGEIHHSPLERGKGK